MPFDMDQDSKAGQDARPGRAAPGLESPEAPKGFASPPLGPAALRSPEERAALIDTAMGRREADLVIKNASVYNPYASEFLRGDLAVTCGRVAGLGIFKGREEFDAGGGHLVAGLIDSHAHIESSMTSPWEFARALCATGVSGVVADPHEIANVAGMAGLKWLMEATENLPVDIYVMAPSCVPATGFEKGGAELSANDIARLLGHRRVLGLAEVMNYPGVIGGDLEVLGKMSKASLIDGHAPGLTGNALSAYVGAGVRTDHECMAPREATERILNGQRVLLREGTAAKNLIHLLPGLTPELARFCHLCTDDRHAGDLIDEGSINHLIALAVKQGSLPLASILNMATLNPSEHYGLSDSGSLAPGRLADMALYPDLVSFKPVMVWKGGRLVARDGKPLWSPPPRLKSALAPKSARGQNQGQNQSREPQGSAPSLDSGPLLDTVNLGSLTLESLAVEATGRKIRVIEVIPGQIVTGHLIIEPKAGDDGRFHADPERDMAKLAVWERYGSKTAPAVGFIQGLGIRRGAIGTTVSHDSHNLVAAGVSDKDILLCAKTLQDMGGGLVLAADGDVIGAMALPLGGLMSAMSLEETAKAIKALVKEASNLGLPAGADPFMTLSFMSLPVIPSLKLTAGGLVDVDAFKIVTTVLPMED